jgi:ATP-binding cassette subfamily B protein
MLRRSREIWRSATMLFVSHDVGDTLAMDRVLVVEGGRIVEDGTPAELLSRDSAYRKLVEGDRSAMSEVWARPEWRRHVLVNGKLESRSNEEAS